MARQLYQEWRKEKDSSRYPFGDAASLVNSEGSIILEGTFLDAMVCPVGGQVGMYLSRVSVTHESVTIYVGDAADRLRAGTTFALVSPPSLLPLQDANGRPAGVLVSEPARLATFQSWGTGDHDFTREQSEWAATVCVPVPGPGLEGFLLDDGSLVAGDVYLVGSDGVIVREEDAELSRPCGSGGYRVIRIDLVGDPLFRRRLCEPPGLFHTPRFVQRVRFVSPAGEFTCGPGDRGDIKVTANNTLSPITVIRVRTEPTGLIVELVGST